MTPELDALLQRGDYRAAAELAEAAGLFAQARNLYEKLFDYARAGQLAEAQGDHLGAIDLFLKGQHLDAAESVRRRLMAELSDAIPAAINLFEQRAFHLQAAELAESIGDLARAARLYLDAASFARAGRLFERLGDLRRAGEAYDAHLRGAPQDPLANLGLARVLQRFGRHRDALPLLAFATTDPRTAEDATRRLAFAFFKLGYLEAGRALLDRLGLPRSLDPHRFMQPLEDELLQGGGDQDGQRSLQGRYRIDRPIPARAGVCFLAFDLLRSTPVTLRFVAGEQDTHADFFDELERLLTPPLPGTNRILELSREGGFVATEAFDAPTLLHLLDSDAPPTAARARAITLQLFETARRAHERGVLHGAINPRAVLVGTGDITHLVDWGLHHLERRAATQTGGADAAFAYRAPEINIGRPGDFTADLYAIAATLHRALTGSPPDPTDPAAHLRDLPEPFTAFFHRALSPHPHLRHPSHDAFKRDLNALPWPAIAQRTPPTRHTPQPATPAPTTGPRFLPDHPDAPLTTARDTLLDRPVLLLRLPPEPQRPVALIDRLHALASPEFPVFQDILGLDTTAEPPALVLEALRGVTLRHWVQQRGPLDLPTLLDAASTLLYGLARVHADGIGLGTVHPDATLFDGAGFRVPTADLLLHENTEDPIQADAHGFWRLLFFALTGREPIEPSPARLLHLLRAHHHLAPQDLHALTDDLPSPNPRALAGWEDWFATLERTVDAHTTRTAIFQRLHALAHADRILTDAEAAFLEEKRRALGLDEQDTSN